MRRALHVLALAAMTLASRPAHAEPSSPTAPAPDRLERAKALFKQGAARAQAGDCEGALDFFLRSRALVPSYQNTTNAAVCLTAIGKDDEALTMYEELFEQFAGDIPESKRKNIGEEMVALRARVGDIRVEGPEGTLYIDGKLRGKLPQQIPVHVLPGQHQVRLVRRGHPDFLRPVVLSPGGTVLIDVLPPPPIDLPPKEPKPVLPGGHVHLFGGPLIGATLGSYAEAQAQSKCGDDCPLAAGGLFGLRGGYILQSGLTLELALGYQGTSSHFTRMRRSPFTGTGEDGKPVTVNVGYALSHDVELRGLFMGPAIGYRQSLGKRLTLVLRGTVALMAAQSADFTDGTAENEDGSGTTARVRVEGQERIFLSAPVFVMPELGVEAAFGPVRVGASLTGMLLLTSGPDVQNRTVGVMKDCGARRTAVGCAPLTFEYNPPVDGADEPIYYGYGPTLLLSPQVFVGMSL